MANMDATFKDFISLAHTHAHTCMHTRTHTHTKYVCANTQRQKQNQGEKGWQEMGLDF